MLSTSQVVSLTMQSEGGAEYIPTDSGSGSLGRPFATPDVGGRVATLETLYDYFINNVPDPDEALRQDPGFLEKLHGQADVVMAMRKRAKTVAQMPWDLKANPNASDDKIAEKVAKYVKWVFEQIPELIDLFTEMQGAVLTGGVGHEFIWHKEADGSQRPVRCTPVHKTRFLFDRLGNMALRTRESPVWGAYTGANPSASSLGAAALTRPAIPGKFIYHMYMREPGPWYRPELEGYNYYGKGEDVALYIPVTFDNFAHRFTMKWLERYGIPPLLLYGPDNNGQFKNMITQIADDLRGESVVFLPKGMGQGSDDGVHRHFKVEQMQVPSPSYDAFNAYYKTRTKTAIDGILLGSSDESGQGETGGYSDHVSRRDAGPLVFFAHDAKKIAQTFNHQLIPHIVNYGPFRGIPNTFFPLFTMEAKEEKDQQQSMDIAAAAAKLVPVAEDDIYKAAGLRKPNPDEKTVFNGQGQGQGENPFDDAMAGPDGGAGPNQGAPPPPPRGGLRTPIGQGAAAGKGSVANKPIALPSPAPKG